MSRTPPFGPAIAFPGAEFVSPLATRKRPMLFGLVDRVTSASPLKAALDRSVERTRGIAERVSQATLNNGDGFSLEAKNGTEANANQNPVNVEDEMIALADEQLRFLATSRLLEKTYASLRSAIRGNGAA
jgi:flagellar basal body rod protein FlgB